jgi:hypothetical protein
MAQSRWASHEVAMVAAGAALVGAALALVRYTSTLQQSQCRLAWRDAILRHVRFAEVSFH